MSANPVAPRMSCPAWFKGGIDEYRELAALLQRMNDRERLRRRKLFGRCLVLLVAVTVGIGSLNRLVLAEDGSVAAIGLVPLCMITALLGLMVLVEILRFVEGHLDDMDLHVSFAGLAGAVVARRPIPDTIAPGSPDAALHAHLRAFAAARSEGKVMMPSLLTVGFTPRPRAQQDDLPLLF